jgi:hypothetical protein
MIDQKLSPQQALEVFGCTEIEEGDKVVRFTLPKPKDERGLARDVEVPKEQLRECLHAVEQVTQFGKPPFSYYFEIKPSDQYVIKGMRGIQVRMRPDPELSKLWEQEPDGWVRDGSNFVRILSLHQATQPDHIFGLLPEWLTDVVFTQLHDENEDSEIGQVVDDLAGLRYRMTTGMRDQIFMSGDQSCDQQEISQYFADKYSGNKLS